MIYNSASSILITRLMLNIRDPSLTTVSQYPPMPTAIEFYHSEAVPTLADSGYEMELTEVVDEHPGHGMSTLLLSAY